MTAPADSTVEPDGATPNEKRPLWKRLLKILLIIAVVAIVLFILSQFIDWNLVWDALKSLEWWEFLVLLGIGLARLPSEALIYRSLLPGLRIWEGTKIYLNSNVVGALLPPPADSVLQYSMFTRAGYDAQPRGPPRSVPSCFRAWHASLRR